MTQFTGSGRSRDMPRWVGHTPREWQLLPKKEFMVWKCTVPICVCMRVCQIHCIQHVMIKTLAILMISVKEVSYMFQLKLFKLQLLPRSCQNQQNNHKCQWRLSAGPQESLSPTLKFWPKFALFINTVFQKKTPTHIIGYKLRSSCLILIIFDTVHSSHNLTSHDGWVVHLT